MTNWEPCPLCSDKHHINLLYEFIKTLKENRRKGMKRCYALGQQSGKKLVRDQADKLAEVSSEIIDNYNMVTKEKLQKALKEYRGEK